MAAPRNMTGVNGPRPGRTHGRLRNTLLNIASKGGYPSSVRPPPTPMPTRPTSSAPPASLISPTPFQPVTDPLGPSPAILTQLQKAGLEQRQALTQMLQQTVEGLAEVGQQERGGGERGGGRGSGGLKDIDWTTSNPKQNIALGRALASRVHGWSGSEWRALRELISRESGWNQHAKNASSGAFGLGQALPATKMNQRAQSGDARAQLIWTLRYIKERYGSPTAALAFHDKNNWY